MVGRCMSKKLLVNGFKWIDNNETEEHVINEEFIKNYNENDKKAIFWKWTLNIQRDYMNYIVIYHSYLKE